jgi:hypothetical protein
MYVFFHNKKIVIRKKNNVGIVKRRGLK